MFCLPSVLAQTSKNFRWLIYFDPESPDWLMKQIASWKNGDVFKPMFRATVSREELISDIRQVIGTPRSSLITTNLDNDDGLAVNFIEYLQRIPCDSRRTAIYLANGIIKSNKKIYLRTDKRNAFCSVRENWDEPVTCWAAYHNRLGLVMPEKIVYTEPSWLQVIHGANVSNRVRGRLRSPANYYAHFAGLIDDVPEPNILDYADDFLIQTPKRFAREAIRGTAKLLIASAFGLQGLDRAKLLCTSVVQGIAQLAGRPIGITSKKR